MKLIKKFLIAVMMLITVIVVKAERCPSTAEALRYHGSGSAAKQGAWTIQARMGNLGKQAVLDTVWIGTILVDTDQLSLSSSSAGAFGVTCVYQGATTAGSLTLIKITNAKPVGRNWTTFVKPEIYCTPNGSDPSVCSWAER